MTLRLLFATRRRAGIVVALAAAALLAGCWTTVFPPPRVWTVEYQGPVLVSADGRTLEGRDVVRPCQGTSALVAQENAAQVAISLRLSEPTHGLDTGCSAAYVEPTPVTLTRPLGSRALVDARNGHRLVRLDARHLLTPGWLPYDAKLTELALWQDPRNAVGCERVWSSPTQVGEVTLTQTEGRLVAGAGPDRTAAEPFSVRGLPAFRSADGGWIEWQQGDQVLSLTSGFDDDNYRRHWTELVRIAESVR